MTARKQLIEQLKEAVRIMELFDSKDVRVRLSDQYTDPDDMDTPEESCCDLSKLDVYINNGRLVIEVEYENAR